MLLRQCWKAFPTVGCSLVLKHTPPEKRLDVYWMQQRPIQGGRSTTVPIEDVGCSTRAGRAGFTPKKHWVREPGGRCHLRSPELQHASVLIRSPQALFSQLRGHSRWATCAGGSASAGICSGPWPPSRCALSLCAAPAPKAACRVGRHLSLWPTAGSSQSRSCEGRRPRKLCFQCCPGRQDAGSLLLPPMAQRGAASLCRPLQHSRSAPGLPQQPMSCPAKRDVRSA